MIKIVKKIGIVSMALAMTITTAFATSQTKLMAKKKPTLSTKSISVSVGKTKKLSVKNAKGYKISFKVKNKKIASLKKSTKTSKKVYGKKKGKTNVIVSLKKGKKTTKLICKITVKNTSKKLVSKVPETTMVPPTKQPGTTNSPAPTSTPSAVPTPTGDPYNAPIIKSTEKDQPTADPNFKAVTYMKASFETGTDGFNKRGGSETLKSVPGGIDGNCLSVSGRTQSWHGANYDMTNTVVPGAAYYIVAYLKQDTGKTQTMKCSFAMDGSYPSLGTFEVESGVWTRVEGTYLVSPNFSNISFYFESVAKDGEDQSTIDFLVDEVSMTQISEGQAPVDPLSFESLKDVLSPYVQNVGTCLGYGGYGQLNNTSTMEFVKKQYNSFTLENEMKPDAILGSSKTMTVDEAKKNGYIIPDSYKDTIVPQLNFSTIDNVLQIAYDDGLRLRGHTLLWHSQTPNKFFIEDYKGSGNVVTPEVMDGRNEFYVRNVIAHVVEKEKEIAGTNGGGSIVYCWDVVNEYLNREMNVIEKKTPSWMLVYGNLSMEPTYVKDAFKFAYDELKKNGLNGKVKLFYNDFNTYFNKDKVIKLINYINEGQETKVCDGIGMQSHLDVDAPSVKDYIATLDAFIEAGFEVQITELDVTINYKYAQENTNPKTQRNNEDQAEYYYQLTTEILKRAKNGSITGITFWGLSDANSWRSSHKPLLFGTGIKDPKPSFYKVLQAAKEAKSN